MNLNMKPALTEGKTTSFVGWDRAEVLANARESCTHCNGFGLRTSRGNPTGAPCGCVLRNIFRACYRKFRLCVDQAKHVSTVRLETILGGAGGATRTVWGRKSEEYIADFEIVSRRSLTPEEHQIFKFHYLLGADWKLCCRRLKMDRGTFFHTIYRIEQKLGRAYRELKPYSIFPLDEYFGGRIEGRKVPATVVPIVRHGLRPPLRIPASVVLPEAA